MRHSSRWRTAALALLTLSTAGCDYWYNTVPSPDQLWYRIPWFDQMIYMRSIRPYSSNDVPRYTVKGTVPIGGGEASWETGDPVGRGVRLRCGRCRQAAQPHHDGRGRGAARPRPSGHSRRPRREGRHALQHLLRHLPRPDRGGEWPGVGPHGGDPVAAHSAGTRLHRRLPVQHHPLWPRPDADVRRQAARIPTHRWAIVNHVRALQAATPPADTTGGKNVMAPRKLRQRLVEASLAGRYDIHLGVGLGLALLGLVLFPLALRGEGADRAWQMFHVNWIYFTGLTGGSIALCRGAQARQRPLVRPADPVRRGGGRVRAGVAPRLRAGVHGGLSPHLRAHAGAVAGAVARQGGVAVA